jgi:hypothetical protein
LKSGDWGVGIRGVGLNVVLEVGDAIVVLIGELDVVVEVLRDFFMFVFFEFIIDEFVEGFWIDAQSAKHLSDFFGEVFDCGENQVIELLLKDFVEWINKHKVDKRWILVIFSPNRHLLWSHFVRRIESNLFNREAATVPITFELQYILMGLVGKQSDLEKMVLNFLHWNYFVNEVLSVVEKWFVDDSCDHFSLLAVVKLDQQHVVMRVAYEPKLVWTVHKIVQLLFQSDVVQLKTLLQDRVAFLHPGSWWLSRFVKKLLVYFASDHKMFWFRSRWLQIDCVWNCGLVVILACMADLCNVLFINEQTVALFDEWNLRIILLWKLVEGFTPLGGSGDFVLVYEHAVLFRLAGAFQIVIVDFPYSHAGQPEQKKEKGNSEQSNGEEALNYHL